MHCHSFARSCSRTSPWNHIIRSHSLALNALYDPSLESVLGDDFPGGFGCVVEVVGRCTASGACCRCRAGGLNGCAAAHGDLHCRASIWTSGLHDELGDILHDGSCCGALHADRARLGHFLPGDSFCDRVKRIWCDDAQSHLILSLALHHRRVHTLPHAVALRLANLPIHQFPRPWMHQEGPRPVAMPHLPRVDNHAAG